MTGRQRAGFLAFPDELIRPQEAQAAMEVVGTLLEGQARRERLS